jgi:hypothetical protein
MIGSFNEMGSLDDTGNEAVDVIEPGPLPLTVALTSLTSFPTLTPFPFMPQKPPASASILFPLPGPKRSKAPSERSEREGNFEGYVREQSIDVMR